MSKLEANVVTIKNSTSTKVLNLKSKLENSVSVINQINLPFSCSEVGTAKSYILEAISYCSDFHSILIDSADFCISTDENLSTEISKIDDWNTTSLV